MKRNNASAVLELKAIGPPSYDSVDEKLTTGRWVERFGGGFHADLSTGKLIGAALNTDEANLIDLVKFGQGNRFSLVALEDEISRLNLSERYPSFDMPIFFLLGRHDQHVPAILADNILERSTRRTSALSGSSNRHTTRPLKNRRNSTRYRFKKCCPY